MSKPFWSLAYKSSCADLNQFCLDKCHIILILIVCSVKIRILTQKPPFSLTSLIMSQLKYDSLTTSCS